MIFRESSIAGAAIIETESRPDERGYFARSYCEEEFAAHCIIIRIRQCNISGNRLAGTIRGMHYQAPPSSEAKLVSCQNGDIFDVMLDLRPESPTYLKWEATRLNQPGRLVYVPAGCAHGYQAMQDNSVVFYQMSDFYRPNLDRGVRWNDVAFRIAWPLPCALISARDASYPDYTRI